MRATYSDLGVRESKLFGYSNTDKIELFDRAIKSIHKILEPNNSENSIRSISQLMTKVFDQNQKGDDLEAIREAIRPSNHFGRHTLSATGNKLLASLAIAHDEKCIDETGYLDIDHTKSIIRSWFANPSEIDFDDSALRNIHLEPTGTTKSLVLGENRLASKKVYIEGVIQKQINQNRETAGLGATRIQIDFDEIPSLSTKNSNEVVLGDMNGNSMRLLHELVHTGIVEIKKEKENEWKQLMESIENNQNFDGFSEKLKEILRTPAPGKRLVLLGDLLCDRAHNDWFMLCIIDFLHESGQRFDILFSNHDCAFVEYYLLNKDKNDAEKYSREGSNEQNLNKDSIRSLQNLEKTLNENPGLRSRFLDMAKIHQEHLKLVSCSDDDYTTYSHAILNDLMFNELLKYSGCELESIKALSYKEKCKLINDYVLKNTFSNTKTFQKIWQMNASTILDPNRKKPLHNPFYACIWNVGPKGQREVRFQSYRTMDIPAGKSTAVHGHTGSVKHSYEDREKLLTLLNHRAAALRSNDRSDGPDALIRAGWKFLQDIKSVSADTNFIVDALYFQLESIRSLASADPALSLVLREFDELLIAIPGTLEQWIEKYDLEDQSNDENVTAIIRKLDRGKLQFLNTQLEGNKDNLQLLRDAFFAEKNKRLTDIVSKLESIFNRSFSDKEESDVFSKCFPRPSDLHEILDGLAAKIIASRQTTTQNTGATSDSKTTNQTELMLDHKMIEQIEDLSKKLKSDSEAEEMAKNMGKMDNYISLDNHFGQNKSDRNGEVLVYLT